MEPTTGQWSLPNAPREGETNAFEGPVSHRHEREREQRKGERWEFLGKRTIDIEKCYFVCLPPIVHCLTC